MSNPLEQLLAEGQSVWYDNISRDIIDNGELKSLVDQGVRGLTSNPAIFDKAIRSSNTYDEKIVSLAKDNLSVDQIYENIAVEDIAAAADLLLPVYEKSNGDDGYVSIEVSPLLSANTEGSINEALRLYEKLSRPNIMIKIPGTKEGIPAVRELLERGVNVNITLLFSVENYVDVANTYVEALRARVAKGEPVDKIRSVASFFVSRVDGLVDGQLDEIGQANPAALELKGKFGIANSRLAYQEFKKIFEGDNFADLKAAGAAPQRPLWASTSTKNPDYSDVLYVEELIGPNTVNTVPHNTLLAFIDHGKAASTIEKDAAGAQQVLSSLLDLGIDIDGGLQQLQDAGVKQFVDAFVELNKAIEAKSQ